ncbi:hypothetical protein TanjilG_29234 [Lupinus angustifolius]|uniref:Uncharacterized protein n=1 Tax=Lupinus angustifolius TaxID=3871 RepID=A0A394DMQ1_LUPAN|nr:hypothetical protein TanjilG_29234 [Lupinus angustifolius]
MSCSPFLLPTVANGNKGELRRCEWRKGTHQSWLWLLKPRFGTTRTKREWVMFGRVLATVVTPLEILTMGGGACVPRDTIEQGGVAPSMAPLTRNEGHLRLVVVQLHGSSVPMDDGD